MKRSHQDAVVTYNEKSKNAEDFFNNLYLPEHVWQLIFNYVKNLNKLIELRLTNVLFKSVIDSLMFTKKFWEKLACRYEIIPWHRQLKELLALRDLQRPDPKFLNQAKWKKLYLGYRKWRNISYHSQLTVIGYDKQKTKKYTCVAVWGSLYAVAINDGTISVISNLISYIIRLPEFLTHLKVTQMGFWQQHEDLVILYGKLENGSLFFWNIFTRNIIPYNSAPYENIRCMNNSELISINNSLSLLIKYNYNNEMHEVVGTNYNIHGLLQLTIHFEGCRITDFFSDAENLVVSCQTEHKLLLVGFKFLKATKSYQFSDCRIKKLKSKLSLPFVCHIPIHDILLFSYRNHVCLITHDFAFGKKSYHVKTFDCDDHAAVTSLKMFCNCIIITYANETIRFIFIDNYQTFEKHGHQGMIADKKISLGNRENPVISFDVGIDDEFNYYLAAVTKSSIYWLKL